VTTRVDVYIRAESRFLGFLASTFFPLVRTRAQHRMDANMHDITTILSDISMAPPKVATRLKKEDSDALLKLIPAPPEVKRAAPAAKPASKIKPKPASKAPRK